MKGQDVLTFETLLVIHIFTPIAIVYAGRLEKKASRKSRFHLLLESHL